MKLWKCRVCGYIFKGNNPPKECPQCSSSSQEYYEETKKQRLEYSGEKLDVLLINGSTHSKHNTGFLVSLIEKELISKKASYQVITLNELNIQHCWCCYSMRDDACTFPCRNQLDDAPILHNMLLNSKAVIIASPINWNNLSARLKDFLDRLTSIQNQTLLGKPSLTTGKVLGILINGHEDGAMKTAMDIFFYFQQMGFILAPYGIAYRTHNSSFNAKTDNDFLKKDKKIKKDIKGLVNNVLETIKLDLENSTKKNMLPISE